MWRAARHIVARRSGGLPHFCEGDVPALGPAHIAVVGDDSVVLQRRECVSDVPARQSVDVLGEAFGTRVGEPVLVGWSISASSTMRTVYSPMPFGALIGTRNAQRRRSAQSLGRHNGRSRGGPARRRRRGSPSFWYIAAEIMTNTDGALLSAATAW
jgi:hypothetical protein